METNNPLDQRISPKLTIWLPLGVAIFLVVATAVVFIRSFITGEEITRWASAFETLVILTLLFTSLVMFIVLAFGIGGMKELSKKMPEWMLKVQIYSTVGNEGTKRVTYGLTRPVILVRQGIAGMRSVFSRK
jgi:hypothetical protein